MRKRILFLIGFLSAATLVQGKIIAPQTPPAPQDASAQVHGLAVQTRTDGTQLPDINGLLTLQDCIDLALANSPAMIAAQLAAQNARVN